MDSETPQTDCNCERSPRSGEKKAKKATWWSRLLKFGLPPIVTIGLCYVLFKGQDFGEIITFIRQGCDFKWIAVAMGLSVVSYVVRAMRWQIQLRASDIELPFLPAVYSIVGTYAVNLLIPRLGEVWRAEYVARRQHAHFSTVLGAMVAERLADTLTVLLMLGATVFMARGAVEGFIARYPAAYHAIGNFLASPWLYLGLATAGIAGWRFMRLRRGNGIINRVQQLARNLWGGFADIFHMKGVGRWLLLTVALWGTYFLSLVSCFEAFGFTREVLHQHGLSAVMVCYVLSSIAMGIPANGGIGPYQIAIMFGLGCYISDLNTTDALAFGNVVLAASITTTILCGIPSFIAIFIENRRHSRNINR